MRWIVPVVLLVSLGAWSDSSAQSLGGRKVRVGAAKVQGASRKLERSALGKARKLTGRRLASRRLVRSAEVESRRAERNLEKRRERRRIGKSETPHRQSTKKPVESFRSRWRKF